MRDAFQIAQGAFSVKDITPVLTHFAIHGGRVTAFDGRVYVSTPAPSLVTLPSFTIPAAPLVAALNGCLEQEPQLRLEEHDRACLFTSDYAVRLPIGPVDAFPFSEPPDASKAINLRGCSFLSSLRALRPFIGIDASRQWCGSVLFRGACGYASNNVVLVEVALPVQFPLQVALPMFAIDELLRIDKEPEAVVVEESALTFLLPGGTYLRAILFSDPWPNPDPPLDAGFAGYVGVPVPPTLHDAAERLRPLLDASVPVICFDDNTVKIQHKDIAAEVVGFNNIGTCRFFAEPLMMVLAVATHADWNKFPRVPWTGRGVRGVLLGLRS